MLFPTISRRSNNLGDLEQIVGRERREREVIADFQLPIVDLIRAAASTQPFGVLNKTFLWETNQEGYTSQRLTLFSQG
jgi:hypothetical protein